MIVVVGSPIARPVGDRVVADGLATAIGRAAAARGAAVQLVGRVGDDPAGDLALLDLAAHGVGHVAVLREPGRPTPTAGPADGESAGLDPATRDEALAGADELVDPTGPEDGAAPLDPPGLTVDAGDVELALRYVPDYRVLVVAADLDPAALVSVVAAAGWSGAHLVALVPDDSPPTELPADATILVRPAADPDGVFAAMVAAYAVALDEGTDPKAAFETAQRGGGWDAVAD